MEKMKMNKKRIAALGATLLFLVFMLSPLTAFAAGQTTSDQGQAGVAFQVRLEIVGDTPSEDTPFTFLLEASDGAPVPASSSVTIHGPGIAQFEKITYTEPGDYQYTISQHDGGAANYQYDTSVYTVDVSVRYSSNGQLIATYAAYVYAAPFAVGEDEGAKEPELLFINEYAISDDSSSEPDDSSSKPDDSSVNPDDSSSKPDESSVNPNDSNSEPSNTSAESNNSSVNPHNPKTGDSRNLLPWAALMSVSAIGIVGCLLVSIRQSKKDSSKR